MVPPGRRTGNASFTNPVIGLLLVLGTHGTACFLDVALVVNYIFRALDPLKSALDCCAEENFAQFTPLNYLIGPICLVIKI